MELSIFVAKIISLVYLAAAILAFSGKVNFKNMVDDFDKSPALTFTVGLFSMILGMLLIKYHNFWVKDWTVIITLFAWAAAIKGFMFMAVPGSLKYYRNWFKNSKAWGFLLLAIGLFFAYFGFLT